VVFKDQVSTFETNNPNYLSWKTGVFQFNDTPIQKIVADLNSFYEAQILLKTSNTSECTLTAQFNNSNLQDIFQILETACSIKIIKDNNNYIIQ
jgi:transmembrane sensor